jgi:iron complex outermembrane receptor protein
MPRFRSLALVVVPAMIAGTLPLLAQSPTRPATRDSTVTLRTVEIRGSVTGQGRTLAANALTRADLQLRSPGTTPLKAAERLPGVNFQSSDPFGSYEWSTTLTIRGFQAGQIGQTFDGITLGNMQYGNFNGLGVGRAVDAENLEDATVTQGSGALGTASSNNLGGVVQYTSSDPRNEGGWTLRQMLGTSNARRTFGRWDTGLKGDLTAGRAMKGYISYSRLDTDKWKGSYARYSPEARSMFGADGILGGGGEQWQDQINAKFQMLSGSNRYTFFYDFSDRTEGDYSDLSMARYNQSGRDWDQFSNWQEAKAAALSNSPDQAYFHSAHGARRDNLAYVSGEFRLSDQATLAITPYFHKNRGDGDWHAPNYGSTAFSPDPIYFRQTQYDNERFGVTSRFTLALGDANRLEAGAWFENNETHIRRVAWRLRDYANSPDVDFANVLRLFFDRTGDLVTTTFYLQNTSSLMEDRLKLTYGAKYLHIGADFRSNGLTIPNAASAPDVNRPSLSLPTEGGILPQVGMVFSATETEQLFANFTENVNAYPYSPQTGVYNTNPAGFDNLKNNTDNEKARTYEAGIRTRRSNFEASLAGYFIDYRNRLIGVAVCPLTATCVSSFANVGSVTSRGVEALLSIRLADGLTWQSSAAMNRSTIDNDYQDGTNTIASEGKDVVDSPRFLGNSTLSLARGGFSGSVTARHVGKRYFTILNTETVPGYTTVDANFGYNFGRVGAFNDLTIRLNAINVGDEAYISTMGTNGFSLTADQETLQAGAKRQFFITIGTRF